MRQIRKRDTLWMWSLYVSMCTLLSLGTYVDSALASSRFQSGHGHYTFVVGNDWGEIPQEMIKNQLNTLQSRVKGEVSEVSYEFAFESASSKYYFAPPYFLVNFQRQQVDSKSPYQWQRQIESALQTAYQKTGMNELTGDRQSSSPVYDPQRHLLTYIVRAVVQGDHAPVRMTNFNAIFFGNGIVVNFYFYSKSDDFEHYLPKFMAVINSFSFDTGYDYLPDFWHSDYFQRIITATLTGAGLVLLSGYFLKRRRRGK